jgi:serine/threonine-protein kinase
MAICPECRKQFSDEVQECPDHGVALLPAAIFVNEDRALAAGTMVGDYRVERTIGEGSFGRVYAAEHPLIGRRVAIKVLHRALSTDPQAVSRFLAEARAIVAIQSPHIVEIYSFGALPDGRQYYVMELLDGSSLARYIEASGPLAVPVALRILAGMADALAAAHAADVIHRDLKPENVLIAFDRSGEPLPKLLDFGVAKLLGDRKLAHRTQTGALVGTPAYMAPEQALGLDIDHRVDIYAYGVVAFEMLTGKLPFEASSLVELVRQHATEPPPPLSSMRPELGTLLDTPLARLLEKDPAARPQTIDEAFAGLRGAATRAGHEISLPTYVSLRPPPPGASSPEASSVPTWDAPTVARTGPAVSVASPAVDTVGGTAGAADEATAPVAELAREPRTRRRIAFGLVGAALAAGALVAFTRGNGESSSGSRESEGASAAPADSSAVPPAASSTSTESALPPAASAPAGASTSLAAASSTPSVEPSASAPTPATKATARAKPWEGPNPDGELEPPTVP